MLLGDSTYDPHDYLGTHVKDRIPSPIVKTSAALDSGPGILSYVGHGATAVWASENLWNNTDLLSLDPQAQQPSSSP